MLDDKPKTLSLIFSTTRLHLFAIHHRQFDFSLLLFCIFEVAIQPSFI